MERERFAPTDSVWNPPFHCDAVAAWIGSFPEYPDLPIRVEAGAYRGKPAHFRVLGPWSRPAPSVPDAEETSTQVVQVINVVLILGTLVGAALIVHDRAAEAEAYLREAVSTCHRTLGTDHSLCASTLRKLGQCWTALGRHEEAEELLLEAVGEPRERRVAGDREEWHYYSVTRHRACRMDLFGFIPVRHPPKETSEALLVFEDGVLVERTSELRDGKRPPSL